MNFWRTVAPVQTAQLAGLGLRILDASQESQPEVVAHDRSFEYRLSKRYVAPSVAGAQMPRLTIDRPKRVPVIPATLRQCPRSSTRFGAWNQHRVPPF
jgi:hypothetical protein